MMEYVPIRPSNDADFKMNKTDKNIIVYAVLFQCDNQTAFLRYHPEYATAAGKLNDAGKVESKHFWSYPRHRLYRESYEKTLAAIKGDVATSGVVRHEVDESRKDNALKSLLNQAMLMVERGGTLDPDTLKVITEVFKKLGILKDDVEVEEKPRRYIPLRCGECQYRAFVEDALHNNKAVNECDYCRTRQFAEQHGWRYNPTKNLDIPNEIIEKYGN